MIKKIKYALNNETGGPNVEELIGIGIGLAVGTALFLYGQAINTKTNQGKSILQGVTSRTPV